MWWLIMTAHAVDVDVAGHLTDTLAALGDAPVADLPPEVRARRADLLDVLESYVAAGQFPHNHHLPDGRAHPVAVPGVMPDAPGRTPVFVDEHGTHCAVGYLLAADGRSDLVADAVATDVHGYVTELATPALAAWAASAGFTLAELARIQPNYEFVHHARAQLDRLEAGLAEGGSCDTVWASAELVVRHFGHVRHGQDGVRPDLGRHTRACVTAVGETARPHQLHLITQLVDQEMRRSVMQAAVPHCATLRAAWQASASAPQHVVRDAGRQLVQCGFDPAALRSVEPVYVPRALPPRPVLPPPPPSSPPS